MKEIIAIFKSNGIRTSIFVDAQKEMVQGAQNTDTDRIELYTESYAHNYGKDRIKAIAPFIESAALAHELGLGINAGHDLSLENLNFFAARVPHLDEVSIGHALVSDALYLGWENTIRMYLRELSH